MVLASRKISSNRRNTQKKKKKNKYLVISRTHDKVSLSVS